MDLESRKLLEQIKVAFETHNDTIRETIDKKFNGKMDRLMSDFDAWKKHETREREEVKKKLDAYIIETENFRKTLDPMIQFFNDTSAFRRVSKWLLAGGVAIGGAYLMIREILR